MALLLLQVDALKTDLDWALWTGSLLLHIPDRTDRRSSFPEAVGVKESDSDRVTSALISTASQCAADRKHQLGDSR